MASLYVTDSSSARDLERRLFAFYETASSYFAQPEAGEGNRFHAALEPLVRKLASSIGKLAVLEPGAGRTVLPQWLRSLQLPVETKITVQDVTPINRDYLASVADDVLIGPLNENDIAGRYDLVISTFVYEHLVHPKIFLETCFAALRPGGALVIFSPKYTVPGYVPPALRHLPWIRRQWESLKNSSRALLTYATRRPAFKVVAQPAVFECDWYRDADAVHMVHPLDARLYLKRRARVNFLRIKRLSLRDWAWQIVGYNGQVFYKE